MNFNNLSKLFRYVNDNGDSIVFDYEGGYLINKGIKYTLDNRQSKTEIILGDPILTALGAMKINVQY